MEDVCLRLNRMFSYRPNSRGGSLVLVGFFKLSSASGNWVVKKTEGRRERESEKEAN